MQEEEAMGVGARVLEPTKEVATACVPALEYEDRKSVV